MNIKVQIKIEKFKLKKFNYKKKFKNIIKLINN